MTRGTLTRQELHALLRRLGGEPVLSIYVDTRVTDPAQRHAWRPALADALRAERARLTDDADLAAFDRAAARFETVAPRLDGTWGAPGWMAFATADGLQHVAALPVRVPTLAVWRDGPFVSPYLRALKQRRPVTVALVDSRSARLYQYTLGVLTPRPGLSIVTDEDGSNGAGPGRPAHLRAKSYPAPRAALATERPRRRQRAEFQRLASALAIRLDELSGDDGWVLIGGSAEWARLAAGALPAELAERTLVSTTLDYELPAADITRAAKDAATALRAAAGQAMLDPLLERAGSAGRASAGVPATQRALRSRAVDLLLLSPTFVAAESFLAEDAVRAAFVQGADVEVLSGDAATRLDDAAGGIAARLRFSIDSPRPGGRADGVLQAAGSAAI
jgi:hypothetical protein